MPTTPIIESHIVSYFAGILEIRREGPRIGQRNNLRIRLEGEALTSDEFQDILDEEKAVRHARLKRRHTRLKRRHARLKRRHAHKAEKKAEERARKANKKAHKAEEKARKGAAGKENSQWYVYIAILQKYQIWM